MENLKDPKLDVNDETVPFEDEPVYINSPVLSCSPTEENNDIKITDNTACNEEIDDIEEPIPEENRISEECLALTLRKEHRLLVAQTMFKRSIKISLKSFLISLSLTFLNFFI